MRITFCSKCVSEKEIGGKCVPCVVARNASRAHDMCVCGGGKALTVGHLVPLFRGGSNLAANIVAQCLSCNCKQGTKIHPFAKPTLFDKVAI